MKSLFAFIPLVALIAFFTLRNPLKGKGVVTDRIDYIAKASSVIHADEVGTTSVSGLDDEAYNYDVVGESFRRDNLLALVRSYKAFDSGEVYTTAILEPEPSNEFDSTAVKVVVDGVQVGYIPRFDSPSVTQMIENSGKKEMRVPVRIGFDTDSPQPLIGVRLALTLS